MNHFQISDKEKPDKNDGCEEDIDNWIANWIIKSERVQELPFGQSGWLKRLRLQILN